MGDFDYIPFGYAEAPGKTREEAARWALDFMDAHSKGRKKVARERLEVYRVRREGPGWWRVYYRQRRKEAA